MDDITSFFSMTKDFKRETITRVPSRFLPKVQQPTSSVKRKFVGSDYGNECRKAEAEKQMNEIAEEESKRLRRSTDSDTDDDQDDDGSKTIKTEITNDVYDRYNFDRILPDLPIVAMRDFIMKKIRTNPVIILEGATGCGKTTQVPQFILDDGYRRGQPVNIVVTQPRRIAAVSIAKRVSKERGLPDLPNVIGYQIGLEAMTNDDTRITYCTTGVLLEKLVACKTLINYTHIILDEVHERTQDMDFLFIVIKQLRKKSPHVKIILMSATIEAAAFSEYFVAPAFKVDRKSNFTIQEFYYNDLAKLKIDMGKEFSLNKPELTDDMYTLAIKLIFVAERIDNCDNLPKAVRPTILIFLPGYYEIGCMNKRIEAHASILQEQPIVVVLHSMITHDEQVKALRTPLPGRRLVILATNIAESSITVPDVKYVIDFCLTKNNVTDTTTNFTSLQMEWCSRSSARQRAGRTGRTMNGRVYRLIPRQFYEEQLDESSRPEICRCALENVVLKAKQLQMGPPCKIMELAMDRPTKYDIENTILLLKESGALLRTVNGRHSDEDGDMTLIGHVMAALPVNFLIAKMVVIGYCFNVLSDSIIIAAGLTTKSIFQHGLRDAVKFYSKKLIWADGSGSDLIAILNAYKAYKQCLHRREDVKEWANYYYLNEKSLSEMATLVLEITDRLQYLGIRENSEDRSTWNNTERAIILKVVFAGAFYPNYFLRTPDELEEREVSRTINGRNPCDTVYFSGFASKYYRPLYVKSIKKLVKQCTNTEENVQVCFDEGTEKVYVTFKQTDMSVGVNTDPRIQLTERGPGRVAIEVYKALKLKKSGKPLTVSVMHPVDALKYAQGLNLGSMVGGKWEWKKNFIQNIEMICLPRKHVKSVTGKISHYDTHSNRFWFLSYEEEIFFNEIQSELNSTNPNLEEFSSSDDIHLGQIVAALYEERYYRARILSIIAIREITVIVQLIDVGLECDVPFSDLRRLRCISAKYIDIPPRVFECRLSHIQPSELHSRYGWEGIMKELQTLTLDSTICAYIYSVENGIASVYFYIHDRRVQEILIEEGYASAADENYISKTDHEMRVRIQSGRNRINDDCDGIAEEMQSMMPFEEAGEVKEPDMARRHITVTLSGPKSPLECEIYTCLHQAAKQSKRVTIESQSVNSIVLDANPQDIFQKCIIAANVTETQRKSELTARETSMMPNIPGFAALMALIFSPCCEFFTDRYKSRYAAILCGLGEHPYTKCPMYGEHDTVFNLDVEIDMKDIENVNKIRSFIDGLLQMKRNKKQPHAVEKDHDQMSMDMKTAIITLLERQRPLLPIVHCSNIGWSKNNPDDILKTCAATATTILPGHNILSLASDDSPDRLSHHQMLVDNNKQLHLKAQSDESFIVQTRTIRCMLCQLDVETVCDLKIHLYSRLHTEQERILIESH